MSLGSEELPLGDLRDQLVSLPADLTIAILDACQSGAISRVKGAEAAPDFSLNSVSQLNTRGLAVMASSTGSELSQESDRLAGSYFTHHLLMGLRGAGDVDGDGRVTLTEAYRYAYARTLLETAATSVGSQHATLETNLQGKGEVPLTYPKEASASLSLAPELRGSILVSMGESIVGELHKVAGNPIRLGLPPGRYTVMVRQPEVRYECIADLVEGREPPLALASCVATSLTTGSQKGGVAGTAFESLSVSKQAGWHFEAQLNLPLTLGRPLQPLPNISATPDHSNRGHRVDGWWRRDTWRGALALTAGILAAVGGWNVWNRAAVHPGERLKGDQLSIQLVRHSGGTVAEDAAVFAEGDLFKVRVTCSRAGAVSWQVSVFQGGEVFFPLSSAEPLHCGNQVLLPGAFRLTGAAPVIVCLGLEEDVVPPERLSKEGIGALPATASCTHVRPLPHP